MLDLVMKEQAVARKRQQATIQEQARQWDRMFWGLSVVGSALIFIISCAFLFYGAAWMVDLQRTKYWD